MVIKIIALDASKNGYNPRVLETFKEQINKQEYIVSNEFFRHEPIGKIIKGTAQVINNKLICQAELTEVLGELTTIQDCYIENCIVPVCEMFDDEDIHITRFTLMPIQTYDPTPVKEL